MPLVRIRVEQLEQLVAFSEQLDDVRARAADLTPAFAAGVDPYLTSELEAEFASEGAHFGAPWAPLAPRTLAARTRPGHGRGGILRDTDALYNAFVNPFDDGAIRMIDAQSYQRGVSTPYYPFLHDGTSRMPARPVVPETVDAEIEGNIYLILREYILTGTVMVPEVA